MVPPHQLGSSPGGVGCGQRPPRRRGYPHRTSSGDTPPVRRPAGRLVRRVGRRLTRARWERGCAGRERHPGLGVEGAEQESQVDPSRMKLRNHHGGRAHTPTRFQLARRHGEGGSGGVHDKSSGANTRCGLSQSSPVLIARHESIHGAVDLGCQRGVVLRREGCLLCGDQTCERGPDEGPE